MGVTDMSKHYSLIKTVTEQFSLFKGEITLLQHTNTLKPTNMALNNVLTLQAQYNIIWFLMKTHLITIYGHFKVGGGLWKLTG
jgi:hypothetical protein